MHSYTVVLCDPAPVMLEGLAALLRKRFTSVKAAMNLLELASVALESPRSVLVVSADFKATHLDSFLRTQPPETRVLVIVAPENEEVLRIGLRYHACGYIDRSAYPADYFAAIEAVMSGQAYVSNSLERAIARVAIQTEISKRSTLTPREMDVLRLVGEGQSSKTISENLAISKKTVEFHRSRLFAKLGVHTAVELVSYAFSLGLLGERVASQNHQSDRFDAVGDRGKIGLSVIE